jgi:hypothetical protein
VDVMLLLFHTLIDKSKPEKEEKECSNLSAAY